MGHPELFDFIPIFIPSSYLIHIPTTYHPHTPSLLLFIKLSCNMLSEFGAHRHTVSEGHITINSSNHKLSFHRRAKSLFSSHWDGTMHSLSDFARAHRNNKDPLDSCSITADKAISICGSLDDAPRMKEISNRRLRYTSEENWRPLEAAVLEKQGLEADAFTGLALTTPAYLVEKEAASPQNYGKRPTVGGLRQYHRPTQINVEMWVAPSKPSEPAQLPKAARKSPKAKAFVQVSHADWAPDLLSAIISLQSYYSSSTLSDDDDDLSSSSRRSSIDGCQSIWKVSTNDDDDILPLVPHFQSGQ